LELARVGVNLVLNGRNLLPLSEVAAYCRASGGKVEAVAGNAASHVVAKKLVDMAGKSGNFTGFIQVAGVLQPGPKLHELSEIGFREVFAASVMATYQMIHAAVPRLLEQGRGLAVFFGSGAAERSVPGIGAYCAAKAAEESLVRQLAVEVGEVTSFIYRPGVVETRMQQQARDSRGGASAELREIFHGFRERGELLTPEQSARSLIHILANDPGRFHGQIATWEDGLEGD